MPGVVTSVSARRAAEARWARGGQAWWWPAGGERGGLDSGGVGLEGPDAGGDRGLDVGAGAPFGASGVRILLAAQAGEGRQGLGDVPFALGEFGAVRRGYGGAASSSLVSSAVRVGDGCGDGAAGPGRGQPRRGSPVSLLVG